MSMQLVLLFMKNRIFNVTIFVFVFLSLFGFLWRHAFVIFYIPRQITLTLIKYIVIKGDDVLKRFRASFRIKNKCSLFSACLDSSVFCSIKIYNIFVTAATTDNQSIHQSNHKIEIIEGQSRTKDKRKQITK